MPTPLASWNVCVRAVPGLYVPSATIGLPLPWRARLCRNAPTRRHTRPAGTRTYVERGDLDGDGVIDWDDYEEFAACLFGPDDPPPGACGERADMDLDGDVDLADFAKFQETFGGP